MARKRFAREQNNKSSSLGVFNPIFLAGGNDGTGGSDLSHYCPEVITLGLRMLSVGGRLPGRASVVWREGARTRGFGRSRRALNLHRDQLPNPPGIVFCHGGRLPKLHLSSGTV